jgi:hypothetical protein
MYLGDGRDLVLPPVPAECFASTFLAQ